jgi:hypothetical protein
LLAGFLWRKRFEKRGRDLGPAAHRTEAPPGPDWPQPRQPRDRCLPAGDDDRLAALACSTTQKAGEKRPLATRQVGVARDLSPAPRNRAYPLCRDFDEQHEFFDAPIGVCSSHKMRNVLPFISTETRG